MNYLRSFYPINIRWWCWFVGCHPAPAPVGGARGGLAPLEKIWPLQPDKGRLVNLLSLQFKLFRDSECNTSPMPADTTSTLSVMQDPVIIEGTPSVRDVLSVALTFGASSSTCESTFSTLSRILTPYRRSMLHTRKANLIVTQPTTIQ